MRESAKRLEFEQAAQLRDAIIELRLEARGLPPVPGVER